MGLPRFGMQFPFRVPSSLSDVTALSAVLCGSLCIVDIWEAMLSSVDKLKPPCFETSKPQTGGDFIDGQLSCPLIPFHPNEAKRERISPT